MVLANLVENAARYSPKGSAIRIRLQRDLRSCRLEVVDLGEGIPRKHLKDIFKMFWRGGDVQWTRPGGTGLGLYIVRNIVRDHKGDVWATSAGPGRGSTFTIRLPRLRKYWSIRERKNLRAQPAARP
jgi:signal transduction histidine kinase